MIMCYLSGISSLKADKAEIDILNKKTKFLWKILKKVQINNNQKMAIIKKFRIKSFKQKKPILKLGKCFIIFWNRQF